MIAPRSLLILGLLAVVAALPASASAEDALVDLPAGFSTVTQAQGLTDPTAVAYTPDGTMLIAEKAGRVRVVSPQGYLQAPPLIDISDHVATYEDRGLLGLAVDSDFASNGYVYLLYTYDGDRSTSAIAPKTSRLARIKLLPGGALANPSDPETVLLGAYAGAPCPAPDNAVDCIPSDGTSHSIGTVRSAPDGTLFLGSGDASSYATMDPQALRTFDERTMSGKILHVDRDGHGLPGHPYCADDVDLSHVCTKLYAKGFRNPFRFYLRPGGGLVVGDVGWATREELDLVEPHESFGWPCWEGSLKTSGYRDLPECEAQYQLQNQAPAYDYAHGSGAAVQAGPRYTGDAYPAAYRNSWFFGDYAQGFIKLFDINDVGAIVNVRRLAWGYTGVDLELAPNGDLVFVDLGGGKVERVVYGNRAPEPKPTASPPTGPAPLTTTLDGSGSLDPDGDELTAYEWDFDSDGSVDATGKTVSHVYPQGAYTATLTVRDARGLAASGTVPIRSGESKPTATIEQPAGDAQFRHGAQVTLRGSGADAEDGVLAGSALHWRIVLHHGTHTHVAVDDATGRELTFTPPGDHDADSFYEVTLTAHDSAGQSSVPKTVTLRPETVALRLDSSPSGAVLSYSGVDYAAPVELSTAIGYHTSVSAPSELRSGDANYHFDHWSDGGGRSHDVTIPAADSTLTAVYRGDAVSPLTESPPLKSAPIPTPGPRAPTVRISLTRPRHAGARALHGHLTGISSPLRVEVALRTRAARCKTWRASAGQLVSAAGCGHPAWMNARLKRAGSSAWGWTVALHGGVPRGSYVVSMRARDARGRLVATANSVLLRLR